MKKILGTALLLCPFTAMATMPVIDYTAIYQLVQEYTKLKELYTNAQAQLDKAKQIAQDAEGHYKFGDFENGQQDLIQREWSPNDWQSALKGLSGGNPARYKELLSEYKQSNPSLSPDMYEKGASAVKTRVYQHQIAVNRAASVNAGYAFNNIKQHLEAIHDISAKIETAPNTKAAIDLNTRLNTELAYISVQELKMLSLINEQLAEQQSEEISSETEEAKFNTLPTKL